MKGTLNPPHVMKNLNAFVMKIKNSKENWFSTKSLQQTSNEMHQIDIFHGTLKSAVLMGKFFWNILQNFDVFKKNTNFWAAGPASVTSAAFL